MADPLPAPWRLPLPGNFVKAAFTTASKSPGDTWVFRAYRKLLRWGLIASLAIPIDFLCLGLLYLTVFALSAMGNPREIVKATFSMFAAVPNYLRWVWTEIVDEVKIQIREAIFGPARARAQARVKSTLIRAQQGINKHNKNKQQQRTITTTCFPPRLSEYLLCKS